MRPSLLVPILLAIPALASAQLAGRESDRAGFVTVFHGPHGGFGELRVYDEHHGQPAGRPGWARDLCLVPIDFVGRTALEDLAADRPRRRGDVPGASRLVLPHRRGNLYRYLRRTPAGQPRFGFLRIGPLGRPRLLMERAGTGPAGQDDPFLGRVGVDGGGRTLLLATLPAAGGDLLEVDLNTGAVIDRTAHLPPLVLSDAGLWLGRGWGFGVATDGVYRFPRNAAGLADPIPFPAPAPTWFSGQAVLSPARTFAATTAGSGPTGQHTWVFGPDGLAQRASRKPGVFSGAGFLPESPHGPYLAVSDDGHLCAWRSEGMTREAWLARVEPAPPPPVQATANAYFMDTLDEVGQMSFAGPPAPPGSPGRLSLAVGSRDVVTGQIEKVDLFLVEVDPKGVPSFVNSSLSSGDSTPPFQTPGTISPEVTLRMPDTGALLIYDEKNDLLLGLPEGQVGAQVLLADVKEIYLAEPAGDALLVGLRRSVGAKPGELFRVPTTLDGPAVQLPGGGVDALFQYPASDGREYVSFLTVVPGMGEFLQRMHLPSASLESWQVPASDYGSPLGVTDSRATTFAQGPAGGPVVLRVWPVDRPPLTLAALALAGFVLP